MSDNNQNSGQELNEGQHTVIVTRVSEDRAVPAWQRDLSVPVPLPGRATRAASWVGWHFMELTGVTVPAAVAVAVTPWAWLVSGAVALGWAVHEIPTATEQARLRAELKARRASAEREVAESGVDDWADSPAPEDETTEDGTASGGGGGSGGAA